MELHCTEPLIINPSSSQYDLNNVERYVKYQLIIQNIFVYCFRLHESMPFVVRQLQILWCEKMVRLLFLELIDYVDYAKDLEIQKNSSPTKSLYL